MLDLISNLSVPEIHQQWHHTIAAYTSRRLTEYTDTFPALSGLARIVADFLPGEECVAGMWSSDLRRSLAWRSTQYHVNSRPIPMRHATFIAPSWSWASVNGTTSFGLSQGREEKLRPPVKHEPGLTAQIQRYDLALATPDPFGPLASASLHLRAPLIHAILEFSPGSSTYYLYGPQAQSVADWIGSMTFDIQVEGEKLKVVRCVALYRNHGEKGERPTSGVGLAVVPVEGREGEGVYRRVGLVWCLRMGEFEGVEEREVVLI